MYAYLIAGLGNVGEIYSLTPHNIGFMTVECIASRFGTSFLKKHLFNGFIATIVYNSTKVYLLKPAMFMNNSGIPVGKAARYYNIPPKRIIVVHDDIDMPLGRIKIKYDSSSGGHKGVESVINTLKTKQFTRVKIGVGRENPPEKYVLTPFKEENLPPVEKVVNIAADACLYIISNGISKAMSKYNRKELALET